MKKFLLFFLIFLSLNSFSQKKFALNSDHADTRQKWKSQAFTLFAGFIF